MDKPRLCSAVQMDNNKTYRQCSIFAPLDNKYCLIHQYYTIKSDFIVVPNIEWERDSVPKFNPILHEKNK